MAAPDSEEVAGFVAKHGVFCNALLCPTLFVLLLVAPCAVADDATDRKQERRFLDAAGPPTLPGLSHDGWAFDFEYTVAAARATDVVSFEPIDDQRALAYTARWLVDGAIIPRRWYVGVSNDVGAASVPSGTTPDTGGSTLLLGNPELWMRGLGSSETGLSAGGGLAVVVPVPRTFSPLELEVVRVVRAVRPADYPHFRDLTFTSRPFFDIRHVIGPVRLQLRQGVDVAIVLRDVQERENRYDLAAFAIGYVGVKLFEQLTLGLEVSEVYQLTADVSTPRCALPCDSLRVQVSMSPSIRFHIPPLAPAISVQFPLSTPLRAEVASYVAGRLHLEVLF